MLFMTKYSIILKKVSFFIGKHKKTLYKDGGNLQKGAGICVR